MMMMMMVMKKKNLVTYGRLGFVVALALHFLHN
jgi:hypothetical protein